ncbi:BAG family molecular chaperone regulator 2 [Strongylocentrotus purpuratus]|uniref:BAG family molecular chaperone regulator 2 n=1 Tax=Strongylocentrotus purpuratus TaxID=7668 RepID=A0A7M7HFP3_STRPU|nr:BAG family molecular chaperone regulator 2 [Strongylocentrotus purpuratus]XP_795015.2 BAG family molecular chaperone regulator 2 [Strongylocentrotus purpuratus]
MACVLVSKETEKAQNEIAIREPSSPSNTAPDEQDGGKKPNDFLLQTLDALELRVEKMRETARSIEDEKIRLLNSLNTMMQSEAIDHLSGAEREELGLYIDRLITRCLTVDINIQTIRTPAQEESLRKVKGYLRDLIDTMQANLEQCSQRVKLYLNSCLGETELMGPVDDRFQGALLGCAAEDQKMIRKKLQEIKESLSETDAFMARLQALKLDL